MKTALLGIGNILLRDEGIGVRAVEAIRERYELPETVEVIDGGTMGLDLLPFIEDKKRVIIIDAVNAGKAPGTIIQIEGEDIPKFLALKMSVHQIGLPDMLSAAKMMGIMPKELCLIGIQPKTMDTGLSFSDEIENSFEPLIEAVMDRLSEWGIKAGFKETAKSILST
ncbi:MAG: HyaD/HybD family hydrogenase maturation endopeptidase [Nitrospirota bacterium]